MVGPEPEEDETPKVSKKERKARRKRLFVNRELSWLSFNERVLAEAGNPAVPLAERLMFVKIFQSNLDEFFRVRVGTLMTQMQSQEKIRDNKTGMTSKQQVRAILKRCRHLEGEKAVIYEQLMGELEPQGLRLIDFHRLSREESSLLERYFDAHIAPYLTPMLMSRQQPFPFLNNEDIYAVALLAGRGGKKRLGIVPCSGRVFKRLVEIPTRPGNYILTEEMILHFISKLYAGTQVKEKTLIRLTRNADIDSLEVYDEDLDYRDVMEQLIRRRSRLSPVRLEYTREMSPKVLDILAEKLGLDEEHLIKAETPLDLGFVGALQDALAGKSELFYPPRSPRLAAGIDPRRSMVDQVLEKDRLLSYPFETMRTFVKLLQDAANDDRVAKIQITLYRLADPSSVVDALVEAAENGKAVEALIELRARFDEANNIEMSRRLEEAGVHVIYGLEQYKVHSKLCLITLHENDTVSHITQVGTGNYNEKTSRQYTDLCLMTSDEEIGEEAASLFCALMMGETVEVTHSLLAAPHCLQVPLLEKIDAQMEIARAGGDAYVGFKINSLTDKVIIEKLIEASQAGVTIDMVVRGICCLKPGVPGETDNIRVISVVDRYLEHSRIYVFGRGEEAEVYISSADLMTRNTIRRVELAAPVRDPDCRAKVLHVFETVLSDNVKGRREMPDGSYEDIEITGEAINSQEKLYAEAYGETYVGPVPEQAEIEFPDEREFPEEEAAAAEAAEPVEEAVAAAEEETAQAAAEDPAEAAEAPERAAEAVSDTGAEIPEEAMEMASEAAEEPAEASDAETAPQAADEAEKPAENGFGQ
ncbi:MAG: polyphosphate kinase 1 [Lachnospiraceae bacterium]|nr:polyphosphate kinase 1 [Lachnospiraceae bacterium]